MKLFSLRHLNLCTNQIDPSNNFCYRMLHLDTWIHFNKIPRLGIHIIEKLYGACIVIANVPGQFHCSGTQFTSYTFIQSHTGRNLHHFLMTPLH